ncbi:hypothetical protein [Georgenia sp. Z1491]|uniref:hypothetical protein n=1 Tax=Georgenia sp. Z1491 TaxID=3416707 RepID=UPI003CE95262
MTTDPHEGPAPGRPTPDDDARLSEEVDRAGHLLDAGDHAGAVTALGDVLGWAESVYGPGDPDVLLVRGELGGALGRLGRHYEAVDVLGPGVVLARELGPEDAETRAGLVTALISALEASGRGHETPSLEHELAQVGGPDAGSDAGSDTGSHEQTDEQGADAEAPLADDLRRAATDGAGVDDAEALVARADTPADRQLLPDALLVLAEARTRAEDPEGAVDAYARRAEVVAALDGPTSGTALRAGARHVTALVEAGRLDEALDANMFLGRDARRYRPDDLELADVATARSADLLAAKGRFEEARQVFAELVALRTGRPDVGPEHLSTLDARHREAWATLEVDPARALEQFEALTADLERLVPPDHPLVGQAANGTEEARGDLAAGPQA